ncbi:inositol oxygenase [Plectosphaerella plurivora]|uniref:Inositol oxygenase n=1 Tax=Plectosphaerella plurivora TaxID=936078 RepID=A0A9P9A9Z2_9PEZI|nr:inositol oxygenase [Plectosphaerella plurivora]
MVATAPAFFQATPVDGHALEQMEDAIEHVNVVKGKPPATTPTPTKDEDYSGASKFDEDKDKTTFRQYEDACDRVKTFYAEQHAKQTMDYNIAARKKFAIDLSENPTVPPRDVMTIWQAMEKLNTLVDDSDPDTELSQIQHLLQTAEAMRRDGKPRWMQLTGLIHDLGKLLYFYGAEGQWDVVGDTFPVGCAFSEKNILPSTFAANPDATHPVYSTPNGIYEPGCGIENLMISWGHDEYMYQVCKEQSTLPREALAMIRYHSFYPWHREGAYREFMCEGDEVLLQAALAFNPYDLYSKSDDAPSVEELKPYYMELIDEYFPEKNIKW